MLLLWDPDTSRSAHTPGQGELWLTVGDGDSRCCWDCSGGGIWAGSDLTLLTSKNSQCNVLVCRGVPCNALEALQLQMDWTNALSARGKQGRQYAIWHLHVNLSAVYIIATSRVCFKTVEISVLPDEIIASRCAQTAALQHIGAPAFTTPSWAAPARPQQHTHSLLLLLLQSAVASPASPAASTNHQTAAAARC